MEYQGKELFRRCGIPVPRSHLCKTPGDVATFIEQNPGKWVIKAQVLMGDRGKAGKIKFATTPAEGKAAAAEIMATPMPPNRQNPAGEPIHCVLVEETLDIAHEAYCAIAIDRTTKRPVVMASRFGGMDVEEVAEKHPESIAKFFVDTAIGYSPFIGRELAFASDLDPGYRKQFPAIVAGLYDLFFRYGAKLVEINPLALTADGKVVTVELVGDLSPSADLGMGEGSVLLLNGKAARPQSKAKDLLRAWIDHLVTAAATAGETAHTGYLVWGEPGRGGVGVVPFEPMDQGAAMGILAGLLGDLLNGRHDHLLPIEAVADPAVNDGYPPGEWIQDKLQDKVHGTFQCLYGPVTHPETYPAADLEALAARRLLLQPFLQALGIRV